MFDKEKTCCFIGHRNVENNTVLDDVLSAVITDMIENKKIDTFLFGSRSGFNNICYNKITEFKEKYPHIKRIYVRGEYPYIDDDYKQGLLKYYEYTYYPQKIISAGKSVYVERNYEMINNSKFCIMYYNEDYKPPKRKQNKNEWSEYQPKSGTKIAYEYAIKKSEVINIYTITYIMNIIALK